MRRIDQVPRNCPVCTAVLSLTRLSCDECGTEMTGHFPTCEYCALTSDERATLRVFLASRGNMKEVERHLGVSYPTARQRFDQILAKLGLDGAAEQSEGGSAKEVLRSLERGEIDVAEALSKLK